MLATWLTSLPLLLLSLLLLFAQLLHVGSTSVSDAAFDQLRVMARLVPENTLVQRKDVLASRAPERVCGGPHGDRYLLLQDVDLSRCPGVSAVGLETLLLVRQHPLTSVAVPGCAPWQPPSRWPPMCLSHRGLHHF